MKKILFLFFISVSTIVNAQLPTLVQNTLNGKLVPSDFENQKSYMVNVDTIKWSKEILSGEFTYYDSKENLLKKLNTLFINLDQNKITHFAEIVGSPFIAPRKKQWVMFIDIYRIDWWFSINDVNKLETITLVKN